MDPLQWPPLGDQYFCRVKSNHNPTTWSTGCQISRRSGNSLGIFLSIRRLYILYTGHNVSKYGSIITPWHCIDLLRLNYPKSHLARTSIQYFVREQIIIVMSYLMSTLETKLFYSFKQIFSMKESSTHTQALLHHCNADIAAHVLPSVSTRHQSLSCFSRFQERSNRGVIKKKEECMGEN